MADAPIGTELSNAAPVAPTQTPAAPSEPQVVDFDENQLVRIKGSDKPVKLGDHVRGFQAQHTKAAQEAARLKRELDNERIQRQRYEQERGRQARPDAQPDVFESLSKLPYLTGEDAVGVVKSIGAQIQQRDQILLAALKQMQQMKQMLGGMHETHSNTEFDSYISRVLTEGGYGQEYGDLAKEIYLAYEGDDLRQEFPRIFADRVNAMEKAFEAKRQAKINSARKAPFVPGKGGQASPSKPLEMKPSASAREIADELWGQWEGKDT